MDALMIPNWVSFLPAKFIAYKNFYEKYLHLSAKPTFSEKSAHGDA